jgi:hypothetical protein
MSDAGPSRSGPPKPPRAEETREDRLKAALKANMARRKAQARARGAGQTQADQAEDE